MASTLTSSSTLAEIKAAYDDNASYEEDASTAKAAAFITACRFLLRRLPKTAQAGGRGGEMIERDPQTIRAELEDARKWLAHNSRDGAVAFTSLEEFRV